jgi:5-methylcytosine-specific restriction endonuclease McrA
MSSENVAGASEKPSAVKCAFCPRTENVRWCRLSGFGDRMTRIPLCRECFPTLCGPHPNAPTDIGPTLSETEMRRETRRQKALDRLGTDHPCCRICGEDDLSCLELHHLEGEAFGATLIVLCRNCHRKVTDLQKDHLPQAGKRPTTDESIGHFLLGQADLFVLLAMKLKEFGEHLIERARLAGKAGKG